MSEKATDYSERDKAAGNTPAQKAQREYHAGDFQTTDPVTGEPRDTPLPQEPNDTLKGDEASNADAGTGAAESAGDEYESWLVEDLRTEAGDLEVTRGDGGEGAPVKADYIKALRKRDKSR